ncbi:hypothetical protein TBK1r_64330 [Stieleria magnilauensis]|uniref:Uncharacterized protein n=1 Tax=Stieleria magnilauensis TaxID=2527963 RepID=A0ABX5XZD8_9BACT|nr:hypothetical protein TBK1r_64330 [Planctomycetes bacterium TBK1r]
MQTNKEPSGEINLVDSHHESASGQSDMFVSSRLWCEGSYVILTTKTCKSSFWKSESQPSTESYRISAAKLKWLIESEGEPWVS